MSQKINKSVAKCVKLLGTFFARVKSKFHSGATYGKS